MVISRFINARANHSPVVSASGALTNIVVREGDHVRLAVKSDFRTDQATPGMAPMTKSRPVVNYRLRGGRPFRMLQC